MRYTNILTTYNTLAEKIKNYEHTKILKYDYLKYKNHKKKNKQTCITKILNQKYIHLFTKKKNSFMNLFEIILRVTT